jgi:hypothetical protein
MSYKDEKPWRQYPMTTGDAFIEVLSHLSNGEKKKIAKLAKNQLVSLHDGLGRYIRNNMGLWSNYRGREDELDHPDWTSFFILEGLWNQINQD